MIPYPVRPAEPEPVMVTPASVRVARWCAAIQVVIGLTAGTLAVAGVGTVSAGPEEFGDLWRLILAGAAVLSFAAAVAVAVPAVLLRRHRPMARTALVSVELVIGVPVALGAVLARHQGLTEIVLGPYLVGAVAVLVAVLHPTARAFTAEPY